MTFALTHDPLHQQSSSSGESLQGQTAYVHAIMTPYDSCRRVLWRLLMKHTDEAGMYHNSATPKLRLCGPEVTEVDGGTKNNRRGRLLKHTNEFTQ
jgi:hypothetical protein